MEDPAVKEGRPPIRHPIEWRSVKRFIYFLAIITVVGVAASYVFAAIFLPFMVAAFLTYLLLPMVNKLETYKLPRTLAVALIVAVAVTVFSFGVSRVLPVLYTQVYTLAHLVPGAVRSFTSNWWPPIAQQIADTGLVSQEQLNKFVTEFSLIGELKDQLQATLSQVWSTGTTLLGGVVNVVLIPFIGFFLLQQHHNVVKFLRGAVPLDLRRPAAMLLEKVDLTLASVIKGQVMVAGILMVFYVIGFSLVGLQSGIAIGVVAGICRIVPYVDVVVGGTLSVIVFLSNFPGWATVIGVVIVFIVVQTVDGMLITPRVIGMRVGLHPLCYSVFGEANLCVV